MRIALKAPFVILATFTALLLMHWPLLHLPYFWDEAGYYVPAAVDFYHSWLLVPQTTLPVGHTPLVMVYLALAWRVFGYSPLVTRAAITLIAAAAILSLYLLARRIATREVAAWSALLLALSPLFFAQTTLVHLDLAAALFTTLAVLSLIGESYWLFALAATFAVLSKETAVVLLPVAWVFVAWRRGGFKAGTRMPVSFCIALTAPLLPLAAWTLYYHRVTGYWTGNGGYLSYNLYSTLSPVRIAWTLLRRVYQVFIGGFNWLLTLGASGAVWWGRKAGTRDTENTPEVTTPGKSREVRDGPLWRDFTFVAAGLVIVYLMLLSVFGGAVLPRYLLPVMPVFYLTTVGMAMRLPPIPARLILVATALCFAASWFINPPYPFPFEDNLAYADFIGLHQQAARYLQAAPGRPRILTAWPATDELADPRLGYVRTPLRVAPIDSFTPRDFTDVRPDTFDLLYLYSRRWEPPGNWVARFPFWLRLQGRYFDYQPQAAAQSLVERYHLRLIAEMERRGQWVRIYAR